MAAPPRKIFAGPRLKRLRRDRHLTQAALAAELDLSPRYLNLMIFAQASRIATLSGQSTEEVRLGDNKIRFSGASRAAVTGFGARKPPCRGFGIAKACDSGSRSAGKADFVVAQTHLFRALSGQRRNP